MSLYRKYRPQTFADVVGQDYIVTTLENAAEQDRLSHAYLFAGSRGTGKTSVARILAKILMIRGIDDEALQRQIIKGVEEGGIVDLLEIDAASNRGIDDVRDLIEKIQFQPSAAASKVYIIDEAHMLTKEAFNALLKTLEEPPTYAHFILATTEINKIPVTIQSRCQRFPFRRIREEDIIRRLQYIADQEHITIDREALRAIAHHVQGGLRDAISLLDQMQSLEKIELADVEDRIGSTGHEHTEALFAALDEKDTAAILQTIRKLEESGVPLDIFLRQLLTMTRDRLHEAIESKQSIAYPTKVLDVLLDALRDMRIAPVPALVLESALLSLCTDEEDQERAPLKKEKPEKKDRKEKQEKKDEAAKEEPPVESEEEEEQATESPEPSLAEAIVEVEELTLESVQKSWGSILKEVAPAAVKISLKNGRLLKIDGTNITVAFASAFHRDTVAKEDASHRVEEIMGKIFKRQLRLHCVLDEEGQGSGSRDDESVNLAEAAAEVF